MAEQTTICITLPGIDGGCYIFIDPPVANMPLSTRFDSHRQAADFAQGLALGTGWPIEDAGAPPPSPAFTEQEAKINETLWLMTTILQDDQTGWSDEFAAETIAREIAVIVANYGSTLSEEDRGMLLSIGAVALKAAAAEGGHDSVDDVLPSIMVLNHQR